MTSAVPEMPGAVLIAGVQPILRATALRLARRNVPVAVCDASAEALNALEADLRQEGQAMLGVPGRLDHESDARRVADAVVARFGHIGALVTGMIEERLPAPAGARSDAHVGRAIELHLALMRVVAPHLAAGGGGRIVNLASSAGRYRTAYFLTGDESRFPEAAGGGAILALTRQLAFELAPKRIRVNAVVVGLIEDETARAFWPALSERDRAFVLEEISLGRLGKPDEAAAAVEFLTSDASSYLTGAAIDVNGGWWMS